MIAATLLVAAAVVAFVWLPHVRPLLRTGERYGIDVSHHQGFIDWELVAADDITFAYIKASEGGDFVDTRFRENWQGAGRSGLDRGAYHFFTLCTPGDVQAGHFLEVLERQVGELSPAVDLELGGNCAARPARNDVLRELDAFLRDVETRVGQRVVLYLGDDFESLYRVRYHLDRPLWLRRIYRRPTGDHWRIWQVSGFARIEGISGAVDLDVMRRE